MAIDIRREHKILFADVPAWLEEHGFLRPADRTVREWADKGLLRDCKIGGKRYTSVEALQEMSEGRPYGGGKGKLKPKRRKRAGRELEAVVQADDQADADLRAIGWA